MAALLADYQWRSIGPASAGGRVTDIKALDTDFRYAIVAAASGGVWKTVNAGTTWTPIFDRYGASSIGAVAIFQRNPQILWVGTGEANNRNSVAWGDGIYKSTDGGQTFHNAGLKDTFQIARVVTHPTDPNIVYVAAIGNLWGYTGDRGVFKTADGGATWQKLTGGLPNDGKTGATDLVMDPANPEVLFAAFYQRLRQPWRFDSGGPNGGIFKTTDGGKTWKKLANGLPPGDTGRIGLDVYRKNPRIVMAIVEHGFQCGGPRRRGAEPRLRRHEQAGLGHLSLGRRRRHLEVSSIVTITGPSTTARSASIRSDDQLVYVLTTSFQWSRDGGKTFAAAQAPFGPNYDHHAMWIDPTNKDRFYLGKDKGLTLTHDHGASFIYFDNLPIAQFYKVCTDMRDPYCHLWRPAGQRLDRDRRLFARRPGHSQRCLVENALGRWAVLRGGSHRLAHGVFGRYPGHVSRGGSHRPHGHVAAAHAAQHRELSGCHREGPGRGRRRPGDPLQLDLALHRVAARSQGGLLRHQLPAEDHG